MEERSKVREQVRQAQVVINEDVDFPRHWGSSLTKAGAGLWWDSALRGDTRSGEMESLWQVAAALISQFSMMFDV